MQKGKGYLNEKVLFELEPSACHMFIYSAFIKCLLYAWHLLDTENLAISLQTADTSPALRELALLWQRWLDHRWSNHCLWQT